MRHIAPAAGMLWQQCFASMAVYLDQPHLIDLLLSFHCQNILGLAYTQDLIAQVKSRILHPTQTICMAPQSSWRETLAL